MKLTSLLKFGNLAGNKQIPGRDTDVLLIGMHVKCRFHVSIADGKTYNSFLNSCLIGNAKVGKATKFKELTL